MDAASSRLVGRAAASPAAERRAGGALLGAALGGCVFVLVVGPAVLLPSNIAWMQEDDGSAYMLSWLFFATSGWSWPPAANPHYGLELAASIYYADALPLFALPAKLLAGFMPFQYFGLWLLLCFLLQGAFAWSLVSAFVNSRVVCGSAAVLFCCAPMFLMRVPMHMALAGHWILLAALWLCLARKDDRATAAWPALLGIAALTHSYLLAMTLALWAPDLLRRSLAARKLWQPALIELPAGLIVMTGALFVGGFLPLPASGLSASGFGLYRANILTMLDSNGWSYLIPSLPGHHGEYEGFAFLGAGVLLIFAAVLVRWRRIRMPWAFLAPRWPLAAALVALSILALSHRWALGPFVLLELPLPESMLQALGLLRSSGRFIWPLTYALMLAAVVALAKVYQGRTLAALAVGAALLQVVDTSAGWSKDNDRFDRVGAAWSTPLTSPFWDEAASRYRRLRLIPPTNWHERYEPLAYLAARHGMATDAVYLARVSADALAALRGRADALLASGDWDRETLYVVDAEVAPRALLVVDPVRDLLTEIDGFIVLAPGWHAPSR